MERLGNFVISSSTAMKLLDYEPLQAEINRQMYAKCNRRRVVWSAWKDALQRAWQRGYIQIGKPAE